MPTSTKSAPYLHCLWPDGFKGKYKHDVCHDLESLFYALIRLAVGLGRSNVSASRNAPVWARRASDFSGVRVAEDNFARSFEPSLECISDYCLKDRFKFIPSAYLMTNKSVLVGRIHDAALEL